MVLGLLSAPRYKFFDTPDGEDFFKKVGAASRLAGATAMVTCTVDIALLSHPKTFPQVIGRCIHLAGPLFGMAGLYSSVSYMSANVRGKDDCWNHIWAGICAGSVLGPWMRSTAAGIYGAALFGLFGLVKKDCIMKGWVLLPHDLAIVECSATGYKWDYSLAKEGERRWTTDPNDTEMDPSLSIRSVLNKAA